MYNLLRSVRAEQVTSRVMIIARSKVGLVDWRIDLYELLGLDELTLWSDTPFLLKACVITVTP